MFDLRKYLYQLGASRRNPSLKTHFYALKKSEGFSLKELLQLQEERLKDLLRFAARHSPYYTTIFSKYNINPETTGLRELAAIPSVSKYDLILNNKDIHSKYSFKKLFSCETSGTGGQVLSFMRNESWDSFNRASIQRGYSWYGVNPWDFNLYFWGYNTRRVDRIKIRLMDFLQNRYRIFDYSDKAIEKALKKLSKAVYVEGYSSMIYELASRMEDREFSIPELKMVKGTSEKIYPHYRDITKKNMGIRMISEYGAAESGIIAFECKEGNMHINMEGVIVEIDEDQQILVTNLMSFSFPVIRYKLGDNIRLTDPDFNCPCGMKHPVLEDIDGRVGKLIKGKTRNFPSLTLYYIFKNLYFKNRIPLNYQAEQHHKGYLDIRVDTIPNSSLRQDILKEAESYFGRDIELNIIQGGDFRKETGKLRDFISSMD